jgi:outer membrane protein assembly factor BamB
MNFKNSFPNNCVRLIIAFAVLFANSLAGRSMASKNDNSLTFVDVHAGKVYTQVAAGQFASIDAETGAVLWSFQDKQLLVFTKAVFSSDALYVAATRIDSTSELIRLDLATGKTGWRMPIEGLGGNASPVICGREVLESDYWHKTVTAFDVATGEKAWTTESQPFLFLFPPAVVDDRAFFLVTDQGGSESTQGLLPLSCGDGRQGQPLPVQVEGVSRTPVLLYDKSVAVVSGYNKIRGTSLVAMKINDGTQLWSALIPDEIARFTPAIQKNLLVAGATSVWAVNLDTGKIVLHEGLQTPTVPVAEGDDLVFFSRDGDTIEARELPSGKLRWSTRLKGRITSNIAVSNHHVYVKTGEAQMASLSITGEVRGYFKIAGPSGPVPTSR